MLPSSCAPDTFHLHFGITAARIGRRTVDTAINLVMIIISVVLTAILLLQTKGSAFGGNFGGGGESIERTRRGFEKTLFQFTVIISIFFIIMAVISSFALS